MKYLIYLSFLITTLSFAKKPAPVEPKAVEIKKIEEKKEFNEKEFKEQMQLWSDKIKSLNAGEVPQGIFEVAEKVLLQNPDMLLVLAEDLAVVVTEKPKLVEAIRKQWLPLSLKPIFVGSSGETLYEMSVRLSKDGSG